MEKDGPKKPKDSWLDPQTKAEQALSQNPEQPWTTWSDEKTWKYVAAVIKKRKNWAPGDFELLAEPFFWPRDTRIAFCEALARKFREDAEKLTGKSYTQEGSQCIPSSPLGTKTVRIKTEIGNQAIPVIPHLTIDSLPNVGTNVVGTGNAWLNIVREDGQVVDAYFTSSQHPSASNKNRV